MKTPKFPRRSSKPSTQSSSARRSAHSDVSSKQHEIDKREQDKRKKASWLPLPDQKDLPTPDVRGAFWGAGEGVSYRWIAGLAIETTPTELHAERERLRRTITTYRGHLMRKRADGSVRESLVRRRLTTSPVETTNLTLPPWAQASIRSRPREEQKQLMKKITARISKLAGKTGREVVGVDWHCDTDKLHLELHTLKIDKKTGRIIEMPGTTTWHLGQDRLHRAGLEDPQSEEADWRRQAEAKRGVTVDLEMTRAIDAEVETWLKQRGLEYDAEERKSKWLEIAKAAKEKRLLGRVAGFAGAYLKMTGMSLLSAYALKRLRELSPAEQEKRIMQQCKEAAAMDQVY